MAISRNRKEELVSTYVDMLEKGNAVFITDFGGMNVAKLEKLRVKLREVNGSLYVSKNTLFRVALEQTGRPVPKELLHGRTAICFALGEAPALAKVLLKHATEEELFNIRGGVLDQSILTPQDVDNLSKLPPIGQVRGQLLGLLQAPARNLASAIYNGTAQLLNVIDAYSKKESETSEA